MLQKADAASTAEVWDATLNAAAETDEAAIFACREAHMRPCRKHVSAGGWSKGNGL